jgi:predicted Zn-dependent protease
MRRAFFTQLLAAGIMATATAVDDTKSQAIIRLAGTFSLLAWQNGYGRDLEDQADRVGLRYAHQGGYDVSHGPRVWQRFRQKYGEEDRVSNFFFSNHSQATARQGNLEREIALNYRSLTRHEAADILPSGLTD